MAKDKKRHGLIAGYVDDEYEQTENDYAEFQEWKRRKMMAQLEEEQALMEEDEEDEAYEQRRRERARRRAAQEPRRRKRSRPSSRQPVRKHKKRHPFRFLIKLLLLFLLIYVAWTLISMAGFRSGDTVKNYLLIGQDRREGEGTERSDSMILASVNKKTKTITLTSLMRDMYVPIPGHDKNRLNAAYELGGMELLDQTIEEALHVKIDGNAEVDFEHFISAMTAVGTLDIELKDYEAEYLNINSSYGGVENYAWSLTPGINSLTPEQALAYSRIRYVGNSDWERTQRQRTVITTAFQKLKHQGSLKMISVASKVIPDLNTDMSAGELTALAASVAVGGYDIGETYRVPFDGLYSDVTLDSGAMVLAPDLEANAEKLHEVIYGGTQ